MSVAASGAVLVTRTIPVAACASTPVTPSIAPISRLTSCSQCSQVIPVTA